jgi:hypothetical protein
MVEPTPRMSGDDKVNVRCAMEGGPPVLVLQADLKLVHLDHVRDWRRTHAVPCLCWTGSGCPVIVVKQHDFVVRPEIIIDRATITGSGGGGGRRRGSGKRKRSVSALG